MLIIEALKFDNFYSGDTISPMSSKELQYSFAPNRKGDKFVVKEPTALVRARRAQERSRNERRRIFAEREEQWLKGENCPDPAIIDSRRIIDLGSGGRFDAVIITKEGETERAFRFVGSLSSENGYSLGDLSPYELRGVEDMNKLTFKPGVILDGNSTFGPNFYPGIAVQEGGLVFEPQEQAAGKIGVWEELEGNGQGAFRMFRKNNSQATTAA